MVDNYIVLEDIIVFKVGVIFFVYNINSFLYQLMYLNFL